MLLFGLVRYFSLTQDVLECTTAARFQRSLTLSNDNEGVEVRLRVF